MKSIGYKIRWIPELDKMRKFPYKPDGAKIDTDDKGKKKVDEFGDPRTKSADKKDKPDTSTSNQANKEDQSEKDNKGNKQMYMLDSEYFSEEGKVDIPESVESDEYMEKLLLVVNKVLKHNED
ncbi:hypothetical protein ABZP36_028561 [Zizania latifolia]